MPAYATLIRKAHNTLMLGSLPPEIRTLYALTYTPADETDFKRTATILRILRKHAPRQLRQGTNEHFFKWIAHTEHQRIKHGKPTPRLAVPGTRA